MVLGFHLHSELNPEKQHTCKHHQHSSSVRETQATRWISQDLEIEGREMKNSYNQGAIIKEKEKKEKKEKEAM